MSRFKLASAQYPIDQFERWEDYAFKLERWVSEATQNGASFLVFPEYSSLELASLFGHDVSNDIERQLVAIQDLYVEYRALHRELSQRYNVIILAGTFPVFEDHVFRNRAVLWGPEGELGYQDKLIMTRFENEQWRITGGRDVKTLQTDYGLVGVNICYDSEFPMIAREQVHAGADLLLVPSCTDSLAGYHRVKIGCQARALENQCYVVNSATVGEAPWSVALESNHGSAAVYVPPDRSFPNNGIVSAGEFGQPAWVYAYIDLVEVRAVRRNGQTLNSRDWVRQFRPR